MNTNKYNAEYHSPEVRHELRDGYISTKKISDIWKTLITKRELRDEEYEAWYNYITIVAREHNDYQEALFYHQVYYDLYSSIEKLDLASDLKAMQKALRDLKSTLNIFDDSDLYGGGLT